MKEGRSSSSKNPLHCSNTADRTSTSSIVDPRNDGTDDDKKKKKITTFDVLLNDYLLQSKYYLRFATVAVVFYVMYNRLSCFFMNQRNINKNNIYEKDSLPRSVLAFFASFFFFDFFKCCADEISHIGGNLSKEDLDKKVRYGPWEFTATLYVAISGFIVNLLYYSLYDRGKIKITTTWALALVAPVSWFVCTTSFSFYVVPVVIKDIAAYRRDDFTTYLNKHVFPKQRLGMAVQIFCIAAMIFEGETASSFPNYEIPFSWSSGIGCEIVCWTIATMGCIYIYSLGAGHVSFDFDDSSYSPKDTERYSNILSSGCVINKVKIVDLGLRLIKQSLSIALLFVFGGISLLFTSFDFSNYSFIIYFGSLYVLIVGLTVAFIRPDSPAHLKTAVLVNSGKKYHVFISHAQEPAQDVVENIDLELGKRGIKCWRDMDQDELNFSIMRKGIEDSICTIVFLTKNNKHTDKTGHIMTSDKKLCDSSLGKFTMNGRFHYDVFLSYRADSDFKHAQEFYDLLIRKGLKVWWDARELPPGKNWEVGFCEGLMSSAIFVCLLSREAINSPTTDKRNITKLAYSSYCDNVVLEWRLAKEQLDSGNLIGIFPILIGDKDPSTSLYSDYFASGCHPNVLGDIVVISIEEKLKFHLENHKRQPKESNLYLKDLLKSICDNQGQKIGSNDATKPERSFIYAIEVAVNSIQKMVYQYKEKLDIDQPISWKYDIEDSERGWDGYWTKAKYQSESHATEKTCSLFRNACAMEISHSILKKKIIIPVMEKRNKYGFPDFGAMFENLPNQFKSHIGKEDVIDYEVRGQYRDAFYTTLEGRIMKACKEIADQKKTAKFDDKVFDHQVFLIFSEDNEAMAKIIRKFFLVKNVKFCQLLSSDKEPDIRKKMLKSEKQIILENNVDLTAGSSIETYLNCLRTQLIDRDKDIITGTITRKPMNYVFIRDKSIVKSATMDLEKGLEINSSYFSRKFNSVALNHMPSVTGNTKAYTSGLSPIQLEGRVLFFSVDDDNFFKELLKGITYFQ